MQEFEVMWALHNGADLSVWKSYGTRRFSTESFEPAQINIDCTLADIFYKANSNCKLNGYHLDGEWSNHDVNISLEQLPLL